ncbi:MAG: hypothetical protein D6805_02830 [Planctomycetota bacterium]|nr:MAG: hypothetical protein D6805_02830 [Planctomycetota bacterium]
MIDESCLGQGGIRGPCEDLVSRVELFKGGGEAGSGNKIQSGFWSIRKIYWGLSFLFVERFLEF